MQPIEIFTALMRHPEERSARNAPRRRLREGDPELAAYQHEFVLECHAALTAVQDGGGICPDELRTLAAAPRSCVP